MRNKNSELDNSLNNQTPPASPINHKEALSHSTSAFTPFKKLDVNQDLTNETSKCMLSEKLETNEFINNTNSPFILFKKHAVNEVTKSPTIVASSPKNFTRVSTPSKNFTRASSPLGFFDVRTIQDPSPLNIYTNLQEWIDKIIKCSLIAFIAFNRKKILDKKVSGIEKVSAETFAETQEIYFQSKEKFEAEFIEIHRQYDPDFFSEVRVGRVAQDFFRFKATEPTLSEFENSLRKYFENKNFLIPNEVTKVSKYY